MFVEVFLGKFKPTFLAFGYLSGWSATKGGLYKQGPRQMRLGHMKRNAHSVPGLKAPKRKQTKRARAQNGRTCSSTDLSRLPILGSELGRVHPQQQSGVLAYRRVGDGEIHVLLIRKLRSRNWGIPKGKLQRQLSPEANAAKEAFEEAGVSGHVQRQPATSYRAVKRVYGQKIVIEVWVYLLEVTETAARWPEMGKRECGWFPARQATALLREPALRDLCMSMTDRRTP